MRSFLLVVFMFSLFACGVNSVEEKSKNERVPGLKYPLPNSQDSLLLLMKNAPNDSDKVNILIALGRFIMYTNPDTCIEMGKQALTIAEKNKNEKGVGNSLNELGVYYGFKGVYPTSLDYFFKSLRKYEELLKNSKTNSDSLFLKKKLSTVTGNVGLVYTYLGDNDKSLEYYFRALKMDESLGNKDGIARHHSNIGLVYEAQKNYGKALNSYNEGLKIAKEIGKTSSVAALLGNMANAYKSLGDSSSGKGNFDLSKYYYSKSVETYYQAMTENNSIGSKNGLAINLNNIGGLYRNKGDYKLAFDCIYRALAISDSIQATDIVKYEYENLSSLYDQSTLMLPDSIGGKLLNPEQMKLRSLYYFKKFIATRDTLSNEENNRQMLQKELAYVFDKKTAATKAENEKREVLAEEELKQKELQRNYFIGGFGLVLLLSGFIFRSYRQKQKANEIISQQKELVEEKQKEILDSIHYSKRIQQSMMPTEKYIDKNLNRMKF